MALENLAHLAMGTVLIALVGLLMGMVVGQSHGLLLGTLPINSPRTITPGRSPPHSKSA